MKDEHIPYEAIIPCGGKGLRMRSNGEETVNKPLLRVAGKELIKYSLDNLPPQKIRKLIVATTAIGNKAHKWVLSSNLPYHDILFSCLGDVSLIERINGASLLLNGECFVLCNADEIRMGLNLTKVVEFHRRSGGLATLVAGYSDHLKEQRIILTNEDGRVTRTIKNPEEYAESPDTRGLVNTGFILMHRKALEMAECLPEGGWSCFLDPLTDAGQLFAFVDPKITYFNINTPAQLKRADAFFVDNS